MAKNCIVCGKRLGFLDVTQKCADGHICEECFHGMGFFGFRLSDTNCTLAYFQEEGVKEKTRLEAIRQIKITDDICPAAKFDDNSRQMLVSESEFVYLCKDPQRTSTYNYKLISYDQIADFEIIEDGKTIETSVRRAVAGGILFGDAGAVVGALTAEQKQICNELKIKITLSDSKASVAYITLISRKEPKNSEKYKQRVAMAKAILSKLQQITTTVTPERKNPQPSTGSDPFAEIRKYKSLLDEGIISQEEFAKKKKELLGL